LHENGATVYRYKTNIVPNIIQQQDIQHTRSGDSVTWDSMIGYAELTFDFVESSI
jgi:hypothetical protein